MKFRYGRVSTGEDNDTFIEIETLEELLELAAKEPVKYSNKPGIILTDNKWREDGADWRLQVYDDYLE